MTISVHFNCDISDVSVYCSECVKILVFYSVLNFIFIVMLILYNLRHYEHRVYLII
jgi:hypothetical protein